MAPADSITMQPNEPAVAAYFDELMKTQLQSPPIQCGFAGEKKGKAIFATKALKAGEPIWTEAPFVAMQHEDNKEFVDACGNCFVPLVNSKEAWERVLTSSAEETDVATLQDFEDAVAFLQKEGGKSAEESYFSVFHLAANQVKCECGVIYCSEKCKKIAYDEHHSILCTHSEDNESPMGKFVNHTLVTNEIFQLAAKVLAKILRRFVSTHDMAHARQPVDMFCKMPWWEVITSEDDLEEEGETLEQYRERFKSLLAQTHEHWMAGLRDNLALLAAKDELNGLSVDAVLGSADEVLNLDFFSRIVGMFEMNNISMEIDHPFHALGEALSEASTEDKKEMPAMLVKVKNALEKFSEEHKIHFHEEDDEESHENCGHNHDHSHAHDHDHNDDDEDDECFAVDDDFVGVEGTALFSGICTMNHSCDPNCTVLYTKDGAAHVFAVHDVEAGEELCISYIDVDQDVEDRRECLRQRHTQSPDFDSERRAKQQQQANRTERRVSEQRSLSRLSVNQSADTRTRGLATERTASQAATEATRASAMGKRGATSSYSPVAVAVNVAAPTQQQQQKRRASMSAPEPTTTMATTTTTTTNASNLLDKADLAAYYAHGYAAAARKRRDQGRRDGYDGNAYDDDYDDDEDDEEYNAVASPPRKTRRHEQQQQQLHQQRPPLLPPSSAMSAALAGSSHRTTTSNDVSPSRRSRLQLAKAYTADRHSCLAVPYAANDLRTSRYFDLVISKAKAPVVCAFAGKIKGKAIYADKDIEQSSRIWTEAPFVAMQHETNREHLRCCQYCFVPLLSEYKTQWHDMASRWNASRPTSSTSNNNSSNTELPVGDDELDLALQQLKVNRKNCGLAGPVATCTCGEVYCSKFCQIRAFHEYHSILCPRDDPYSAMNQFLVHMRHTNDIFLLVAKVIARLLSRFFTTRDIIKAREPMDMFYKKPWWEVVMMEKEIQHIGDVAPPTMDVEAFAREFSRHQSGGDGVGSASVQQQTSTSSAANAHRSNAMPPREGLSTHLGDMPGVSDGDADDTDGVQAHCLRELLTYTHQLLLDAVECNLVHLEREDQLHGLSVDDVWSSCASILSFEFFAAQLGLFEMNNVSMEIDHPFRGLIEILDPDVHSETDDLPVIDEHDVVTRVRHVLEHEEALLIAQPQQQQQQHQQNSSNSSDQGHPPHSEGFLGVEGTALFPIICTMNHSCEPNCTVLYTKDGNAHVVAVRDIKKGEELCICYIDIDEDVRTREANLREYQFKCFCSRCSDERREHDISYNFQVDSDSASSPPSSVRQQRQHQFQHQQHQHHDGEAL